VSTPETRSVRPASPAEIALLRTSVKYGQTPDVRQAAEERLLELGVDPHAPEAA
jgi:hypothetical protein